MAGQGEQNRLANYEKKPYIFALLPDIIRGSI